jgi:AraC-like DNA-binding protein
MQAGDLIVFPHEEANLVSNSRDARLVRGVLRCDARQFNPLLSSLPRQLHVTGEAVGWLAHLAGRLVAESREPRLGSETVLTRMAEVMFIEVLRHYAEQMPASRAGWLAGLIDPVIGPALTKLHAQPERGWTLADLAHDCASSRSVLAERFSRLVGMPPMCYLKRWRLQLAAEQLTRGTSKVSSVGARVGYESEAAFSRAFKQETGMSPAAWRRAGTGGL